MEDKLKEIGRRLEAMATVGDAVTDEPLFAIARELLELPGAKVEPPLDLHDRKALLDVPVDWTRDGLAFVLRATTTDFVTFDALVFHVPSLGIWKAHVAMNGSTILHYEDEARANAMYQAREAIYRAWKLRGPVPA